MKEWINKHKRDIGIGVIVSLITGAILKIGDWIVNVVPTIYRVNKDVLHKFLSGKAPIIVDVNEN